MATAFTDGFDKYGSVANPPTQSELFTLLAAAGWVPSVFSGGSIALGSSLVGLGLSLYLSGGSNATAGVTKYLPNINTAIGGMWFAVSTYPNSANTMILMNFVDQSTTQCEITVSAAGRLVLTNGAGTILGTSAGNIVPNVPNYICWNIVFGASGAAYTVYLNNVAVITGTGATKQSGNSYYNGFSVSTGGGGAANAATIIIDHLYVFDTTTAYNIAPILTSPEIYTSFEVYDGSVSFTPTAGVLGNAYASTTNTSAPGANELFLEYFTPTTNCTIASVSCIPAGTNSTANTQAVIYGVTAGVAHTLLSGGTTVVGTTANATLTGALTTPQALIGGTTYAIGFITDTSIALQEFNAATNAGVKATNTFTSGAPTTAPALTIGQPTWVIWGNLTTMANNYQEVAVNPPLGALSYVSSSTVGAKDLYGIGAIGNSPSVIYTAAVYAYMAIATAGARTAQPQVSSNATVGTGNTAPAPILPTYLYYGNFFDVDPHTSLPWTVAAANAAYYGVALVS